jgi:hypothetical protein
MASSPADAFGGRLLGTLHDYETYKRSTRSSHPLLLAGTERGYLPVSVATWTVSLSSAIAHPDAPEESAGIPAWVNIILVRP